MENINIFINKEALFKSYSELILKELEGKELLNICLSGGSTPRALFDYLTKECKESIPWQQIRFFWGDERCVPPTNEESNFGMTRKHLLEPLGVPTENVFRILGENDPVEEAYRYDMILGDVLPLSNGVPEFDIMMLGLGDDGHTASIFPHQIHLWNSEENCVVGTHPASGQKRVSLTGKVINNASVITFLVTGEGKAEKVKILINPTFDAKKLYPAALVKPNNGNLLWFLDDGAAKLIR